MLRQSAACACRSQSNPKRVSRLSLCTTMDVTTKQIIWQVALTTTMTSHTAEVDGITGGGGQHCERETDNPGKR